MKQVVLLGSTPPPIGGIAKWTTRMMAAHLKDGWQLSLVDEKIVGERQPFGDKVRYSIKDETTRWFSFWKRLNREIRKSESVLAHACPIATSTSMLANIVSAIIVKLARKKHIVHFRCTVPNLVKTRGQKLLLKALCDLSDYIIVLNTQSKQFISRITKTPVEYIPNFVDAQELVEEKNIRERINKAVYVGGVIKEKGCLDLIEAARLTPEIEFRLVGVASSEVNELSKQLANVVIVGEKDKTGVQEELSEADVFMFVGRFPGEGFSNSLAEAMAAGLPCVVMDWAANADMIEDGKGGVVINASEAEKICAAINKISSPQLREAMSKYNMVKVRNSYNSDRILSLYVDVYNKLNKNNV